MTRMIRNVLFAVGVAAAVPMLAGCPKKETPAPATGEHAVYVCPMHPNERSDHPAKCPVCGMDLVRQPGKGGR